jgi:hypothetical protein
MHTNNVSSQDGGIVSLGNKADATTAWDGISPASLIQILAKIGLNSIAPPDISIDGKYNAVQPAIADGSKSILQIDQYGNLNINLGTLISGEDQINDRMYVSPKVVRQNIYSATLAGVGSWAGSGNLDTSGYQNLIVNVNIIAITATSVTFNVNRLDSFGNAIKIANTSALTGTGTNNIDVTPSSTKLMGDTTTITMSSVALTSVTFQIDVWVW